MNSEEQTMSTPSESAADINPLLTMMNNATADAIDENADDAEIVRQLKRDMPEGFDVETHGVQPGVIDPLGVTADEITAIIPGDVYFPEAVTVAPVITGEFINQSLRNVRASFDARKKRGAEFKGARTRLDKLADAAVREFRAEHLSELSDEQALKISLGDAGLIGDNVHGFSYVEGE